MRQCGQSLFGEKCYVATLDPCSFNPFKGYCLCAGCSNSSDVYQRLFPHLVPLHEPPDTVNKVDTLCGAYLTGPRHVGCSTLPECNEPLTTDNTDEVFVTDNDPRS